MLKEWSDIDITQSRAICTVILQFISELLATVDKFKRWRWCRCQSSNNLVIYSMPICSSSINEFRPTKERIIIVELGHPTCCDDDSL